MEEEVFPIHWKPWSKVAPGYPHDRMEATRTRPVDNRWLEITSPYGWTTGELPQSLSSGELECEFKTEDVRKEFVIETHQLDGIDSVAESNWPVKVGIIFGRFFCEYAFTVYSDVTKRLHAAGDQAYCDEPVPISDKIYHLKIRWEASGRYRWWLDGVPMKFTALSRYTGEYQEIPGFEDSRLLDSLSLRYHETAIPRNGRNRTALRGGRTRAARLLFWPYARAHP